ncbi:hypothetical protein M427DRAFT_68569 [Gonapodya prolifera JEL478]|uniref:Autophagy-related protein 3 n=1 Tax=Gonapodya prolifera (strain JEL478) TaxID=1344416 RepID=A0A139AKB6_GONPJ|nr:hypothetical protein M427DRAFT_68569 [Gonapodya prolifera JEL478]|eukprot:KXS17138.1 hypothetical protein M427DRAFT_68569 [Gonapodya prolifera JEL478]
MGTKETTGAPSTSEPSLLTNLYNQAHSALHSVREQLTPIATKSSFLQTGTLTPEEFVRAGDFLVDKCPTWTWAAGAEAKRKGYLPNDKQFLITRKVPCRKRVWEIESEYGNESERLVSVDSATVANPAGEEVDPDSWIETHVGHVASHAAPVDAEIVDEGVDALAQRAAALSVQQTSAPDRPAEDEIPDIEEELEGEFGTGLDQPADAGTLSAQSAGFENSSNIIKTRTYDMSISYDNYYKTPRVFLAGFTPTGTPLTPQQIFEDVSSEHAHKTATVEQHPHERGGATFVGVHPCKHAEVMRRIVQMGEEQSEGQGEGKGMKVEWYMMIFLKFISSVLPTVDYDYTVSL